MPATAPWPGKWKTDRTPYVRAPMHSFVDPDTDVVVVIMRRQRAKTELGLNCLGFAWKTMPGPSLWITPTEKLARSMAADRIEQMFDTVEGLRDITSQKARGSLERYVAGSRFGIGWAGSRTEVASHPCKYAVIDERSRMVGDAGGEGDPVRIIQEGGAMFPGATSIVLSSPTEEGICPTYAWWAQGTRMRWCWRCQGCGEWFVPCWATVVYPERAPYHIIREEAQIRCPTCERMLMDEQVKDQTADYVPAIIDENGEPQLSPELEVRNSVASYWVTGLADQITSIGKTAESYVRAAREGEPGAVQAIVNTACGELWRIPSQGMRADAIKDRQVEDIPADDIQLVTVGVDVQEMSLYLTVRGWCAGVTSYLLAREQIHGATEFEDVWTDLAKMLDSPFMGRRPALVLIDSGYQTAMVYAQCRKRLNWAPAKGLDRAERPYWDTNVDESVSGRPLKTLKLWRYSADTWKQWLYARIRWDRDQPGAWYVPNHIDDEYCAQVTNERSRISRGKRIWETTGNRQNHYGDCEVLAAIAADIQGVRRLRPRETPEVVEAIQAERTTRPRGPMPSPLPRPAL